MPTPRDPNLTDRFLDFMLMKEPRGLERERLSKARPPLWVRLIFILIIVGLLGSFLFGIFSEYGWLPLPWEPPFWPHSIVFLGLFLAEQFAYREVLRQYGKRAEREGQSAK